MLSTDILSRLRQATSSRHAMLDQAMPLADPAATLETYRDHLMLLRQWLAPIEHWQARFADGPQAQGLLPQLAHVALIDADLQHPSIPVIDTPAAAGCGAASLSWQQGDDAPYRWGVSYVIEGSRLGGEVLRRQLAVRLAPHPLHYLGDEQGPGERWTRFLRLLKLEVTEEGAVAEACRGACDAFDGLIALLPVKDSAEH